MKSLLFRIANPSMATYDISQTALAFSFIFRVFILFHCFFLIYIALISKWYTICMPSFKTESASNPIFDFFVSIVVITTSYTIIIRVFCISISVSTPSKCTTSTELDFDLFLNELGLRFRISSFLNFFFLYVNISNTSHKIMYEK